MINIKSESKLMGLTKEYNKLNELYSEKQNEIADLEDELDGLEYEMNNLENQITAVKQKLLYEKIDKLSIATQDKFTNDFIKASFFCDKDIITCRPILQHVWITDDSLIALDGFRLIRIKCDSVPDELKNKKIMWDIRDNFIQNISLVEGDFPPIQKIFDDAKSKCKLTIRNIRENDFYTVLKYSPYDGYKDKNQITLTHNNLTLAVNKEFIDIALLCLRESEFNIHLGTSIDPILLENENIEIIILPVRMRK